MFKMTKITFARYEKNGLEIKKTFQFVYYKTYPEVCSCDERQGIDLRKEFHLKFNEWNGKNLQQKFEERQQLPTPGAIKKELVTESDHEEEKKLANDQKEKELEEKKSKKRKKKVDCSQKERT